MRISTIAEKGIFSGLIEKGIEFFLKNQCNQINSIKIDIFATSMQIIKGEINKINLKAKEINYKELLFDEIELEAENVKIKYKINKKKLVFKNEFIVDFKLKLSEKSVRKILTNKNWSWIENLISKAILNLNSLNNITIENNEIRVEGFNKNINDYKQAIIGIHTKEGKVYIKDKSCKKNLEIPIDENIYINKSIIQNNLIIILAKAKVNIL
tara:strand:- start:545 stop:1180 length:636 start_codon:yes stop_codon:yes gene_type:complete